MIVSSGLVSSSSSTVNDDAEPQIQRNGRFLQWIEAHVYPRGDYEKFLHHSYRGNGTNESPFLVEFITKDPQDPMLLSTKKKWIITFLQAIASLSLTFASSAFSGGLRDVMVTFDVSQEVATLGISLFVLGFAIGPLLWAPLSELYGRQIVFVFTYMALTAFNVGAACANNIAALLICRFLAAAFGASTMTNGGGVIADMFDNSQRGLATSLFAMAPFLGPTVGPIASGFLGEAKGWRWLHGLMAIFTGVLWILNSLVVPETYAPVLLRQRAQHLSKMTGKTYISNLDAGQPEKSLSSQIKIALTRPLVLLLKEPIVLFTSLYTSIIYGTLYMCFAAFPIVFQQGRGWSRGIGGLAFGGTAIGVLVGTLIGMLNNRRYARLVAMKGDLVEPEARLPLSMIGSILTPVGLFWFAWTTFPSVHWIVPIIGSAFFACGLILVFLSLMNYFVDSYVVYAASVLAANSVLRSLFGAAFPLFTRHMYERLGNQWASSIPAFLALACVPCPFLFHFYGRRIRMKCKYASEAAEVLHKLRASRAQNTPPQTEEA